MKLMEKEEKNFFTRLNIDISKHRAIAFVGGGGKTSLIWKLTEELVKEEKKVAVITTTHMAFEENRPFAPDGEGAEKYLKECGYVLAASVDTKKGKLSALSADKMEALFQQCDILLIEADGARKKPFKIPMAWEPVVPEFADLVVAVIGLDAVGRTIKEAAYNPCETSAFLEKEETAIVSSKDIVKAASDIRGLRKGAEEREYRVYLNKTDVLLSGETADEIVQALCRRDIYACFGSLKEGL